MCARGPSARCGERVVASRSCAAHSIAGELPPWYLNPLITFPSIFAVVGVGFYLVILLGGVHRGEVAPVGDDLKGILGDAIL